MSRARLLLVSGALVAVASSVRAWSPIDSTRPVWTPPVPYGLQNTGSDDLPIDMLEPIVRMGFEDWSRRTCVALTTRYNGRVATRAGASDGQSVIGWVESGWRYETSAIGVTGPRWTVSRTGVPRIVEADMEMNGVNFRWITGSGRGNTVNTYSIVLHESGHYFGLGHSSSSAATMYAAYTGGTDSITADDEAGICSLYPGGSMPADCTTLGCPGGMTCVDRMCVARMGDGSMCSPCTSSRQCSSGSTCLRYPDGSGYCATPCTSSSSCGTGGRCLSLDGDNLCIRFSGRSPSCEGGTTTPGCTSDAACGGTMICNTATGMCMTRPPGKAIGEACMDSPECSSGLCLNGACTSMCNWLNVASCPSGFYCNGAATGTCGEGYCVAGAAGTKTLGSTCASNTECASLFCSAGVCSSPCIPGGAATCPAGYACQVGSRPSCGACKVSGALGDPCTTNAGCTSGLCVESGGRSMCTQGCDSESPCASGFRCDATGPIAICVPERSGLGVSCTDGATCLSGICAGANGSGYCTRICSDSVPCPASFSCELTSDNMTRVCYPSAPATPGAMPGGMAPGRSGCGCAIPSRASDGRFALLAMAVVAAAVNIRRRRRR